MTTPYARSGIHIKPENEGKFTSYANQHGESVQQAAHRILANKGDYPQYLVKRANFARNAAGWHHGRYGIEATDIMKAMYGAEVKQYNNGGGVPPFGALTNNMYGSPYSTNAYTTPVSAWADTDPNTSYYGDYGPHTPQEGEVPMQDNSPMFAEPLSWMNQLMPQQKYAPVPPALATPLITHPGYGSKYPAPNYQGAQPLPDYLGMSSPATQQPMPTTTPQANQERDLARPYFNLAKFIDASALLSNMVQAPPPTIQMPLTHMPRVHYDRTIFDQQAQNLKESGNRSMYEARQQLGQAGDIQNLMLGLNAQQQQGMAQLGTAEREMNMNEALQNAQIAGQEQQMQDQQNTQEMLTNYQIQQQAQQAKDAAVQHQLSNIKTNAQQESQYYIAKGAMDKQAAMDKEYKAAQQDIGLAGLEMQYENAYKSSPDYLSGKSQAILKHAQGVQDKVRTEMMADPTWKDRVSQSDIYTGNFSELSKQIADNKALVTQAQTAQATAKSTLEQAQADLAGLQVPDNPDDMERYRRDLQSKQQAVENAKSGVAQADEAYGTYNTRMSEYQRQHDVQTEMLKRIQMGRDYESAVSEFDKTYRANSPTSRAIELLRQKYGSGTL